MDLHVVLKLEGGFAREDAPTPAIVGAFTDLKIAGLDGIVTGLFGHRLHGRVKRRLFDRAQIGVEGRRIGPGRDGGRRGQRQGRRKL